MIQLSTSRLILRTFKDTDFDRLFAYRNDPDCARFQRYEETSEAYLRDFIKNQKMKVFGDHNFYFAIASKDSDVLIGDIFTTFKDKTITLGITISPEYQRMGYAYEALKTLIGILLEQYSTFEIVALIHPDNNPSIHLFEKLEFDNEGYVEKIDSFVFTMNSGGRDL